ncbi:MAG: hypothetical protein ACTSP4_00945 [Candidatus Hodarchaeales archaeon]
MMFMTNNNQVILVSLVFTFCSVVQDRSLEIINIQEIFSSIQLVVSDFISLVFSSLTGSFLILLAVIRFTLDGKDGKILFLAGIVLYLAGGLIG